jgi:predicted NAD/FAD-dependent oxidoreductase
MKSGARITEAQLKKWRYSVAITTHPQDYIQAEGLPLLFAGDAFGGRGRVEGAFISGRAAAQALLEL